MDILEDLYRFDDDGEVENEADASAKLIERGFNPDNVGEASRPLGEPCIYPRKLLNPMTYFCIKGDLKMCRYLLSRGASTTANVHGHYPMLWAASCGNLTVCKWLFANGATDISPFDNEALKEALINARVAWNKKQNRSNLHLVLWFLMRGACDDRTSGDLRSADLDTTLGGDRQLLLLILDWAESFVQRHHASFFLFLCEGTINHERPSSIVNQYLSGCPALLMKIGDYAGVLRGRDLRKLTLAIPQIIAKMSMA